MAFVSPWGFDPADVATPTLLLHGAADPVVPIGHARWLAAHIPGADLRITTDDGHVSVLDAAGDALGWLLDR